MLQGTVRLGNSLCQYSPGYFCGQKRTPLRPPCVSGSCLKFWANGCDHCDLLVILLWLPRCGGSRPCLSYLVAAGKRELEGRKAEIPVAHMCIFSSSERQEET